MTSLMHLPEEILIIIIKKIDIKSAYNLYKTCQTLRNIVLMQGVIRKCKLSCNSLASPKSLQLDMIRGIAGHLRELNMCGVSNLRKSVLLPAVRRMKCLITLNVSYTEINVIDMLDLYKYCPTIKDLTINYSNDLRLTDEIIRAGQEIFKNFINVHFIMNAVFVTSPLYLIRTASLENLKFTLCDVEQRLEQDELEVVCPFKHICIFLVNNGSCHSCKGTWTQVVPIVFTENIEYIIIEYNSTYSICSSPMFKHFLTETFKISSFFDFHTERKMYGTVAIFIWNKECTVFDDKFYSILKSRIKKVLACEIKVTGDQILPPSIDNMHYDWFHVHPIEIHRNKNADTEPDFKRRRIVRSDHVLDYDKIFSVHDTIKLSVYFPLSINASLSSSNNYLRKLTYLSLTGSFVRYSNDFFNILFRCCNKLTTLNVEASSISNCCSFIMRSIPLSQSLQNMRLVDKRIDFKTLFSSFSQCRTLENICVIDSSNEINELADLGTLYQCLNLYSLHIQAEMTKSTMTKITNMNKILVKTRSEHINFIVEYFRSVTPSIYNPYLDVFKLKPIKPV